MNGKFRLSALAVICLVIGGWVGYGHASPPAMAQRWEYKSAFLDSELIQLGAEGWELVAVTPPFLRPDGILVARTFYLKRKS